MAGQSPGNRSALWLRRMARGLGVLLAGFWLFIGILQAFVGSDPWTIESAVLAALIVAGALAVAVGWWRAGIGGLLLMLVGAIHCAFAWLAAGHNKFFAVAITGIPFLLVGALFLASWWLLRRRASAQV